nr:metallophosphoesterase [Actinomycetota bacterium]
HGSERCFRKFLNAAAFYDAQVLIMGGDITGKVMTPVIEDKPGRFVATISGSREKAKRPADLEDLEKRIRFNGFYPYRCSREEYERLVSDRGYQDEVMSRVMVEEIRRWMAIADEKLVGTGVQCLIMPGNDDEPEIDAELRSQVVENPDARAVRVGDCQMISCSWANATPWDSPRELPDDALAVKLEDIAAQLDPELPAIFNLHVPPYDTGLDTAPQVDQDLRVVTVGGQPSMVPVGSRAVRELVERRQPLVSLHGHIHESRGVAHLGRTLCLNPGSNYADGVLDGAIVDIEDGAVAHYQLVSG